MAFGTFTHRADAIWDDRLSESYQFPGHYLKPAKRCEGDWIIYREPHTGGVRNSRGYFAVAKVQEIIPDLDPQNQDGFLAIIERGTYLEFDNPVPFRDNPERPGEKGNLVEQGLLTDKGKVSGIVKRAIRPLLAEDFARIIERGLGLDINMEAPASLSNVPQAPLIPEYRNRHLIYRVARNGIFREKVLRAYRKRCAITGLQFINGGGLAEVEAAHIRPVAEDGPDIINNGIALSRTVHWMFDRGLLGLTDDLKIMVSRQSNNPDTVWSMIKNNGTRDGSLLTPHLVSEHPRTEFVAWHREHRFKH